MLLDAAYVSPMHDEAGTALRVCLSCQGCTRYCILCHQALAGSHFMVWMQMTLHDLRGSQAVLLSTALLDDPQNPTSVDLHTIVPLSSLCLPLASGKDALTAGIEQLPAHVDATSVPAQQKRRLFGPALQVCWLLSRSRTYLQDCPCCE